MRSQLDVQRADSTNAINIFLDDSDLVTTAIKSDLIALKRSKPQGLVVNRASLAQTDTEEATWDREPATALNWPLGSSGSVREGPFI